MTNYECGACGFQYRAEDGYEEGGIAPGTNMIDVPRSFKCPKCGKPKAGFKRKL